MLLGRGRRRLGVGFGKGLVFPCGERVRRRREGQWRSVWEGKGKKKLCFCEGRPILREEAQPLAALGIRCLSFCNPG